jgi:hypothetical protein
MSADQKLKAWEASIDALDAHFRACVYWALSEDCKDCEAVSAAEEGCKRAYFNALKADKARRKE